MLFFPRGILDEILNLIESVSEGFPSYFYRGFISSKLYNKRDDFVFDSIFFYFLDGEVPRRCSF